MDKDCKLDIDQIKKYKENVLKDSNFEILSNSVQRNGVSEIMFNTQNSFKIQDVFNNEVEDMA